MRKKKVLFLSNYCGNRAGFAGFMKEILTYLYRQNKYELCLVGAGVPYQGHPDLKRWPWKVYGTIPSHDQNEINRMNADPGYAREVSYGTWAIDRAIKEFKPDIFIGSEDPWSFNGYENKSFWNKISCVIHTTLDSRPILERAVDLAKKTPYFFSWADFATKEMNKMGLDHVKTLRGSVNTSVYCKLPKPIKQEIRAKHNIPLDAFCMGMVFRNQLRKAIPNLLNGYKLFKEQNPGVNSRLILATHFGEGWDIPKLIKEYSIDNNEVLAVYKCRATQEYFLLPFTGQDKDNPKTGHPKSLVTMNIADGITDEQLNEVYNVLDVYAHPFTSGGQERPIQEAKLCELITLVTNYSCGEDCCEDGVGSLALDWAEYREPGTQFIKASTKPASIAYNLQKVLKMPPDKRSELGKAGRKWVLENFSIEVIGKKFEELIDSLPYTTWDFKDEIKPPKDPNAVVPDLPDNLAFVTAAYKLILGVDVLPDNDGVKNWLGNLAQGQPRQQILDYFRKVAAEDNSKNPTQITPEKYLRDAGVKEGAVLVVFKESAGDTILLSSLFKSLREQYPDRQLVVSVEPKFREILEGAPGLDLIIDFQNWMDNQLLLQGIGNNKPLVFKSIHCRNGSQLAIDYLGQDNLNLNLKYDTETEDK